MTRKRRQQILLAVLAVLLAWVAWNRLGSGGSGGDRNWRAGGGRSRAAAGRGKGGGAEVLALRAADLELSSEEFRPGRDPFRFAQEARPAPPQPRPTPRPMPTPEERQREAERQAETAALRPPPLDLVYLGSFGPERQKIAVFSDRETIYNARVGDVLEDAFELVQIGYESVDLKYVNFPDEPVRRLAVGGS